MIDQICNSYLEASLSLILLNQKQERGLSTPGLGWPLQEGLVEPIQYIVDTQDVPTVQYMWHRRGLGICVLSHFLMNIIPSNFS